MNRPLPTGAELLDLDDLIEDAQLRAASADAGLDIAMACIDAHKNTLATIDGRDDLRDVLKLLASVKTLSLAAHQATLNVATARLLEVR